MCLNCKSAIGPMGTWSQFCTKTSQYMDVRLRFGQCYSYIFSHYISLLPRGSSLSFSSLRYRESSKRIEHLCYMPDILFLESDLEIIYST